MAKRVRTQYTCQFPIGWNLPGTFPRLAVHLGMILAWLNAGLPLPSLVVATSAGAIMSACCISFNRAVVRRVVHLIRNLQGSQIYRPSGGLYKTGFILMAAGGMLVLAAASAGSLGWWAWPILVLAALGGYVRFWGTRQELAGVIVALVGIVFVASWKTDGWVQGVLFCGGLYTTNRLIRWALQVFFKECGALFDNSPLRNLLLNEQVPQNAFRADTELLVLAADVVAPGCVVYSNHEPRLCDPENPLHCEQFVDGVLNSAALPARFPARSVRGKEALDGEIWADADIHQFLDKDGKPRVQKVFRFDYWEPLGPGAVPETIIDNMLMPFDRMRDRCTILTLKEYGYEREHDPALPQVVHIRASSQLSAKIPDIAVHTFQPGDLWRAMKFGRAILRENLPLIRRELGLDDGGAA